MTGGATAAPMLRMRDVVPAAVAVVLLLGIAGCMGALGGGPLDVTPIAHGPATITTDHAPAPADVAPSFVLDESQETMPAWLEEFADRLDESKRSRLAPDTFRERKPFLSCGEFVLDQGAEVPQAAWDCLAGGVADGAELVEVRPTIEGDPVISYYRVGPGIAGVEIYYDASFDAYGSGEWSRTLCKLDPASPDVVGECPGEL